MLDSVCLALAGPRAYPPDVNPFEELTALVDALASAKVDYALCGAVALAVYGAPRATQDIDVLVRPEDVARVREVARGLGFTLESHPMKFSSGFTVHRVVKMIGTQPFMLDLIEASEALATIFEGRETIRVRGASPRVWCPAGARRTRRSARTAGRVEPRPS